MAEDKKEKQKKENKPLNFILIGRSGCGKGTQVELLIDHFGNLKQVSTGDLFRDLAKQDTVVGKIIKNTITKGGLPYDDLAITLWMYDISYRITEDDGIIADGMPRRLREAKAFDHFLKFLGREDLFFPILLEITREEAFNRLTKRRICKNCGKIVPWLGEYKKLTVCDDCGGELINRPDDTPEAIKNRLDYYDTRASKVADYYAKKRKLIKINGEQSIEDVFAEILKKVEKKLGSKH